VTAIPQPAGNILDKTANPLSSPVLISGASGMLGTALSAALRSCAPAVLQLVRQVPAKPNQIHWNPEATPGAENLRPLEGLAAAIHLSGANLSSHRWTSAYKRELVTTRVQSTRSLVATLLALQHPPPVLLVASAVGYYGDRGDALLDERSSRGDGFLADLCEEWERASRPAADAGIRVVHLRFGVVLSHKGGALAKMLPLFRLGLGGRLGSGHQWVSWISLTDLVEATLLALRSPTLSGPVNLTAPNPVTNAELTRALSRAVHRPAILPAPAFALRLAMGEMADAALLSSTRVHPAKLVEAGFEFAHPTIAAAIAATLRDR
jgi:uncharacterized protein (TIGR01777 family)